MNTDKKFWGICIVIASLILSGTLLYINLSSTMKDRYKVVGDKVFDTQEGKFFEGTSEVINSDKEMQASSTQDGNSQVLNHSIVKYYVELPKVGNDLESFFSANMIKTTIENLSDKYVISYLEADNKLYKDDVLFLKDTIIIDYRTNPDGTQKAININPLSSYETIYHMDPSIDYPDQPWKVIFITKKVMGFPIE